MLATSTSLHIRLLGFFEVLSGEEKIAGLENLKVRELFCYLLLNRDRTHAREKVASELWGSCCTTRLSKKYLRDALWRLKSFLATTLTRDDEDCLEVEAEWIRMNSLSGMCIDIQMLENAGRTIRNKKATALAPHEADLLEDAVAQYRGELLESWQQDWCVFERERFIQLYLTVLDYLMEYYASCELYHCGIQFGHRILKIDSAREYTHQQIMRLYARSGNRTDAIRQYHRCVETLKTELGIAPAPATTSLFDSINGDFISHTSHSGFVTTPLEKPLLEEMDALTSQLYALHQRLATVKEQVARLMTKKP